MPTELTAIITCAQCALDFEGVWRDDSLDEQDRAEAPVAVQQCPGCGHTETMEYPGWSFRNEAG